MPDGLGRAIRSELRSPLATILWGLLGVLLLAAAWDDELGWRPRPRRHSLTLRFVQPDAFLDLPGRGTAWVLVQEDWIGAQEAIVTLELLIADPSGWIAPVFAEDRVVLAGPRAFGLARPLDAEEVADIRAQSLHHATEINWQGLGGVAIGSDGTIARRVLWFGVAMSAAIVVCGLGLLYSLAWIPRVARGALGLAFGADTRHEKRSLAVGRCPRCGYRVEGLARCPECGRRAWCDAE